jgi:hypothetical protein
MNSQKDSRQKDDSTPELHFGSPPKLNRKAQLVEASDLNALKEVTDLRGKNEQLELLNLRVRHFEE